MKAQPSKIAALTLCVGLLLGAQRPAVEYRIWVGAPPDSMSLAFETYIFDATWQQRSIAQDEWILARRSGNHIRLQARPGWWWYSRDGAFQRSPCDSGPFRWIMSPSGSVYACVDSYNPKVVLRVFRSSNGQSLATIKLSDADVEGRNEVAFLDDTHVLYSRIDTSCPRESSDRLPRSIAELSMGGQPSRGIVSRCASGVIVGTRHVAYTRERSTAYAIDGGAWVNQTLYGFDEHDDPITDDSAPIRDFKAKHPDLAIWLISVGLAPT